MKILITGASRGIGLAEARQLSRDNELFLVATSKSSFKDKKLQNQNIFGADLTKENEINKFVEEVKTKTDSLDVLINNVGEMVAKKFEEMSEEEIISQLDINLKSHLLITKKLLPLLKRSGNPQIIFMSSMAAKSSNVGESVYSAAKGAITNFAKVLRNELKGKVKVSVIHSWGVNTWGAEEPSDLLEPKNIAEVVKFIISREKSFVIESVNVGHINQWRGGRAPWSPE